ncbi:MAG TPA: hypothetical protein V6C97_31865 [Oculatellaceae cyanobacterium]
MAEQDDMDDVLKEIRALIGDWNDETDHDACHADTRPGKARACLKLVNELRE